MEAFIRTEDPKKSWNLLTFISRWTKRGKEIVEKWLNYVGNLKEHKNDFSKVYTEFSQSQLLVLNDTTFLLVKRWYFSCWNFISWKEDQTVVLVFAIFQVFLTQNCQYANVGYFGVTCFKLLHCTVYVHTWSLHFKEMLRNWTESKGEWQWHND